jgi:release factor glutamine methyltransferase
VIVRDLIQRSASWLAGRGFSSARLEAELLLAHVLQTERLRLYLDADKPLEEAEVDRFRELMKRRARGEPAAYITGQREFYGLAFEVNKDVLIPRPETELIVDKAREKEPRRLLDIGTGSGCIAVACAVRLPEATVVATDISDKAIAVARRNAETHGVSDRVEFRQGDLFEPIADDERFDLIVSNPPYVSKGGALPEVDEHEPHLALYPGESGLEILEKLIPGARAHLRPGGALIAEIADEQAGSVRELAEAHFGEVTVHPDLAGMLRVLEATC